MEFKNTSFFKSSIFASNLHKRFAVSSTNSSNVFPSTLTTSLFQNTSRSTKKRILQPPSESERHKTQDGLGENDQKSSNPGLARKKPPETTKKNNTNSMTGWWLNQPHLKNMLVKMGIIFPINRGENKTYYLKPPSGP